ncbi:MAG TPA: transporter substrate-binding domain-containing protein [Azospirillaceae bacterium]|nr:transporter substrate-binding domain-containing protein [Azospirillaceae bacterium]
MAARSKLWRQDAGDGVSPGRRAVLRAGLGAGAAGLAAALPGGAFAAGREVLFGFRLVPPFVMEDPSGRLTGIEYDIVSAALAVRGHRIRPYLGPLPRLASAVRSGSIDGAAPVLPSFETEAVRTSSYIIYRNVALTLDGSGHRLATVEDLAGLRVMAFPNATKVLGPAYAAAVARCREYREEAKQMLQVRNLFHGRVDVAIGERRILGYYVRSPVTEIDGSRPMAEHDLFEPTEYEAAFRDPALAADFEEGLRAIRADGTYAAILQRYEA